MLLIDNNKRKRMGHEIHNKREKQNIANLKYVYIYDEIGVNNSNKRTEQTMKLE